MKLKIRNINKVSEADINIDGLTVIAGVNSTGKSTIGKILFSMVKAWNNAYETHGEIRTQKLNKEIDDLYDLLNEYLFTIDDKTEGKDSVTSWFPLPVSAFRKKMESYVASAAFAQMKIEYSVFFDSISMDENTQAAFIKKLENIYILTSDGNGAADSKVEFDKFVDSEFMGKLCTIGTSESNVEFSDASDFKLSIKLVDNAVKSVNSLMYSEITDATYVESPLYLHILDSIVQSVTFLEMPESPVVNKAVVPAHIKDFAEKVCAIKNAGVHNKGDYAEVIHNVSGGVFEYNKDSRQIVYSVNGERFAPINVASGMKAFGMLQMLLDMKFVSGSKVLIWDEPENHLHPEWQVEFAKIMVDLAANGMKILVTTHSPYFIQGVRFYAAKQDVEDKINYYLAENTANNRSVLRCVNNTLNDIYQKLTAPLVKVMNVDAQRKRL